MHERVQLILAAEGVIERWIELLISPSPAVQVPWPTVFETVSKAVNAEQPSMRPQLHSPLSYSDADKRMCDESDHTAALSSLLSAVSDMRQPPARLRLALAAKQYTGCCRRSPRAGCAIWR